MRRRTDSIPRLRGSALALALGALMALSGPLGCDSKEGSDKAAGDKKEADKKEGGGESELATKVKAEVVEIKAELEKGEDIKYSCAGNLAQYEELEKSTSEGDKKAYGELITVCFVDGPTKLIADLRAKLKAGELDSFDTVSLETILKDDQFPKEGPAVKVAEDAKKLIEIEIPTGELTKQLAEAAKEKEAGATVSMGCIKAKQVVDKSGEALKTDDAGKAALEAFATACPEK